MGSLKCIYLSTPGIVRLHNYKRSIFDLGESSNNDVLANGPRKLFKVSSEKSKLICIKERLKLFIIF